MEREEAMRQLEDHINGHCPADFKRICKPELMCSILELLKEQEARIRELEEELRALKYGDQDTLKSAMMPAT